MSHLDELLHQARRDVEAAVDDVVPPPLVPVRPSASRRVAVVAAAAAVFFVVIGGSTWWVRSQDGPTDRVGTETAVPATTQPETRTTAAAEADRRRLAQLESRLAAIGLDLRTLTGSPTSTDVSSLQDRHTSVVELAEDAGTEMRALVDEMGFELEAIVELADRIDTALTDLESKRGALGGRLQLSPVGDQLAAIEEALGEAEAQVATIRAMRDELATRAGQLEAEMTEVYLAVAPGEPVDEITITQHDYGLQELGGGTRITAVSAAGLDVWATTGLVVAQAEGRDYGLVLHIDGSTGELIEQVEVPQPMRHVAAGDEEVWLARTGDGALPDNLVARIDVRTLEVEVWNVGDLSIAAIAPTYNGLWVAGSRPATLSLFDPTVGDITASLTLGGDGPVAALALAPNPQPVLWVATAEGRLIRLDADSGEILGTTETEAALVDLAVTGAIEPNGGSPVWAIAADRAFLVGSEGTVIDTHVTGEAACCVLPRPGISDGVWLATRTGQLRYLYPGGDDLVASVPFPTDDPDEGGGPTAIAESGPSVWLAQGAWLTEVRFPQ